MKVELVRYPSEEDWLWAKQCAIGTVGLETKKNPTAEWRRDILRARHSPIRELVYRFVIRDVPYYVAMHLVRHHVGFNWYVKSQRNDRQTNYDRNAARQDAPVTVRCSMNAESLMVFANKRLCKMAAQETREVAQKMCVEALKVTPELNGLLVPHCEYHGGVCHEMNGGCGRHPKR